WRATRYPLMDCVHIGPDDVQPIDVAYESPCLRCDFITTWLVFSKRKRIKETPAVRLANHDHPLLGITEVREVGVVTRVADIEVALDIHHHLTLFHRPALDRDDQ